MSDLQLDYVVPSADLRPYVTLFYHFFADVPAFADVERANHAQLRFLLIARNPRYSFSDGTTQIAPANHVVGPTFGPTYNNIDGPLLAVGMGLQAVGWSALLGIDASTMVNRVLDGATLFGSEMEASAAQMRAVDGVAPRVAIAEAFLRSALAAADTRALAFARQIDAWLESDPSPDVADLVTATGLSRRQIERRCNALYGGAPKFLARKYRALRAAVALASGGAQPGDLVGTGFYDQSHLIRELKEFTGLTPRQLRDEPSRLARLTMTQRRALEGQVHPTISET